MTNALVSVHDCHEYLGKDSMTLPYWAICEHAVRAWRALAALQALITIDSRWELHTSAT